MTVRDVTAVCPAPVVEIDRAFAVQPPACVKELGSFRFEDEAKWIEFAEQSGRELVWRGRCMNEVADWIEAERAARITPTELTQ